ncbi:hypothetical protein RyT2_12160 [Pseudolactococcus yaeyamensis]
MFEFLEEKAKELAKNTAGTLMSASVKKDLWLLENRSKSTIKGDSNLKKSALLSLSLRTQSGLKGKAGTAMNTKVKQIRAYNYYKDGAGSIK